MSEEKRYTLKGRLADLLPMYPVERGSLWYVWEDVWQTANPDYEKVRNKERIGHFGLCSSTLQSDQPVAIGLCHGHSHMFNFEEWYHLVVTGITTEEPERRTCFDVWHRYPVAWRDFFSDRVQRHLPRPSLSSDETEKLQRIESKIKKKIRYDRDYAIRQFQQNKAWQQYFPDHGLRVLPDTAEAGSAI